MKKCGLDELCFENGEEVWGHFGWDMCLHLGENQSGCICNKTGEQVDYYSKTDK